MAGKKWSEDDPRLRRNKGCKYGHGPEFWVVKDARCRKCSNERKKASREYRLQREPDDIKQLRAAVTTLEQALHQSGHGSRLGCSGFRSGYARPQRRAKRRRTGQRSSLFQPGENDSLAGNVGDSTQSIPEGGAGLVTGGEE